MPITRFEHLSRFDSLLRIKWHKFWTEFGGWNFITVMKSRFYLSNILGKHFYFYSGKNKGTCHNTGYLPSIHVHECTHKRPWIRAHILAHSSVLKGGIKNIMFDCAKGASVPFTQYPVHNHIHPHLRNSHVDFLGYYGESVPMKWLRIPYILWHPFCK